uniref:BAR domain-containing protein n=1 Tax=Chromera velia CCMP2878 TaxID=1169474 RepID=A0A0G4I8D5_9ALVE|eukprot:Cvel_11919.t1-p1 / transcript=Cvel_11919.t1 / gene=Cvel_11919 / organism=Chromera_velia_CCMP2878 / gene_product=hypothetical protein / transcript_product=hypothetical protein / location=Cvel_scaffold763:47368-51695(+) / protein_length=334 / sequence_SO=supercontig / SO=protein_coding / is_pseudo=false
MSGFKDFFKKAVNTIETTADKASTQFEKVTRNAQQKIEETLSGKARPVPDDSLGPQRALVDQLRALLDLLRDDVRAFDDWMQGICLMRGNPLQVQLSQFPGTAALAGKAERYAQLSVKLNDPRNICGQMVQTLLFEIQGKREQVDMVRRNMEERDKTYKGLNDVRTRIASQQNRAQGPDPHLIEELSTLQSTFDTQTDGCRQQLGEVLEGNEGFFDQRLSEFVEIKSRFFAQCAEVATPFAAEMRSSAAFSPSAPGPAAGGTFSRMPAPPPPPQRNGSGGFATGEAQPPHPYPSAPPAPTAAAGERRTSGSSSGGQAQPAYPDLPSDNFVGGFH